MTAWGRRGVSPVVAVILLVAITIVLAAVVYITVLSLAPSAGQAHGPVVLFWDTSASTANKTVWRVSGTDSNPRALAAYTVILRINNVVDNASTFDILLNGKHGKVEFNSLDDRLNVGDTFGVDVLAGKDYELIVFFRETSNEVGRAEWVG